MRKKNESVELPRVNHFFKSPFFFMRIKKKKKKHGKALHPQNDFGVEAFFKTDRSQIWKVCLFLFFSLCLSHAHTCKPTPNLEIFKCLYTSWVKGLLK